MGRDQSLRMYREFKAACGGRQGSRKALMDGSYRDKHRYPALTRYFLSERGCG